MNNIVGILDLDRFTINKKFLCRELGIIKVGQETATSYDFDIGIHWGDLSQKDRKTCMYVSRYVHKLPLVARRGSLPLDNLNNIVNDFYNDVKTLEKSVMAYKGGHLERNLLNELNIPSVNLESFGCPKAEELFGKLTRIETCGQHIGADPHKHCPKVEVEAFHAWLNENKEEERRNERFFQSLSSPAVWKRSRRFIRRFETPRLPGPDEEVRYFSSDEASAVPNPCNIQ